MRKIVALILAMTSLCALSKPIRSSLGADGTGSSKSDALYDAEVQYLESTGTQFIDTGFYAVAGLGCEITAAVPSGYGTWINYGILGWNNDWQGGGALTRTFAIVAWVSGAPASINFAVGDGRVAVSSISIPYVYGNMMVISYNAQENTFSVDGSSIQNPNTLTYTDETRPVNTMPLFGIMGNNSFAGSAVRIREAKFFYNGQIVKDLVAVRFTNDNNEPEGAMLDRETGVLYRNAGTDNFIIGPDL